MTDLCCHDDMLPLIALITKQQHLVHGAVLMLRYTPLLGLCLAAPVTDTSKGTPVKKGSGVSVSRTQLVVACGGHCALAHRRHINMHRRT
jgi:hypothetical protein